jgi:hypothetical protein
MFTFSIWWIVWALLGMATIGLVVLLRTHWQGMRPLKKCAILSLWVHVLLACLAAMVQIFSGSPGIGHQQPIRVVVLPMEYQEAPSLQPDAKSATSLHPETPALVAPELESPPDPIQKQAPPDKAEVERVLDPVPDPPSPAPPVPTPVSEAFESENPPNESPEESVAASSEPRKAEPPQQPLKEMQAAPPLPTPTASGIPAPSPKTPTSHPPSHVPLYADRFAENRKQLVAQRGGNERTERAVRSALAWLAGAQAETGGWEAARHGAGREHGVLGHNRQGAGAQADTGVTGLALLAFLGSGHTHRHGAYSDQVAAGLDFLRRHQSAQGALHGKAQLFARTYCHSMATFAVCEAYALTEDPRLAPIARAATAYSLQIQNGNTGGWRYRPGDAGDTSQLGWQVMALKSAQLAGIDVPPTTWTRIERFLRHVRRGSAGGLAAYRPQGPASRTMTAEALYCRQLLAGGAPGLVPTAAVEEAVRSLSAMRPMVSNSQQVANRMNLYYWYYATLALHRAQHHSATTHAAWEKWNQALVETFLATQQAGGSWDDKTVWGGYGGRVYTTSLAALCLEVYYRYRPDRSPADVARRGGWHSVLR